jgi:phage repressor protein C with HTH and peptisase S24 domain
VGPICRHEAADLGLSLGPQSATSFELGHEWLVVERQFAEAGGLEVVSLAEGLNVGEQTVHLLVDKLDIANCQRWTRPAFARMLDWSNYSSVSDPPDIQTIRENLRRIMKRKDKKPTTLSLAVGTNRTLVKDLLEKSNDIQIGTLIKLAGALDVDVADLVAAPRVSVVGYIGAGGEVLFEDMGHEDSVLRPPGISGTLIALVVRGSSMLPKYRDGDIIYIQRTHEGVLPEYIGEDCAVRLTTGETFIKQLIAGNEEGKFTLLSLNAPPMENVEVEWATLVRFVMPARSRQLLD